MLTLTPSDVEALALSLRVALWSVVLSLPIALLVATLLARHSFPGKTLLNVLAHLPLVLPPVVTGYLLLLLLGRRGPIGAWLEDTFGLVLAFRWTGAVVAAAVMSFPLLVRPIRLSLETVDRRLEEAAATLGAPRPWIYLTVVLPLALPGILTGALLGLARSLGEFGATVTFVANIPGQTRTLASAIYTLIQTPGGESGAIRLSLIAIVLSVAALIAAELLGRGLARRVRGQ
jgi:molybdate transport system permease protein